MVFSIKNGETLPLRFFTAVTNDCVLTYDGFEGVDVLDGPPEVSVSTKDSSGAVNIQNTGKVCPNPFPGVTISISVKDLSEAKEAPLVIRVRFRYKQAYAIKSWQTTYRYHLMMYPGQHGQEATKAGAPSDPEQELKQSQ
jgi:hypothetical protein